MARRGYGKGTRIARGARGVGVGGDWCARAPLEEHDALQRGEVVCGDGDLERIDVPPERVSHPPEG